MKRTHATVLRLILLLAVETIPVTADAQQWNDIGEVVFTDGWISPMYTGKAERLTVQAQTSADGSLIRLVEPYSSTDFSGIAGIPTGGWGTGRNVTFDISDPSWVRIVPSEAACLPAGVLGTSAQTVWPTSRGEYMHALGYSREAITDAGLNSVYENMTITIPQAMVALGSDPGAVTQSLGDIPVAVTIDISTASVQETEATSPDTIMTPRYFTITGIPVTPPLQPGIYIMRTGSVTKKTAVE